MKINDDKINVLAGKYLTFMLGSEEYGINILKVKEIVGMMPINVVPQYTGFMRGVINLRDHIIPVADLRTRFSLDQAEYSERTCIIVVEVQKHSMQKCWEIKKCGKTDCPAYENPDNRCWMISGTYCRNEIQGSFHEKIEACRKCNFYQDATQNKSVVTMGLIVDSVSDVSNIGESNIESAPRMGNQAAQDFILGMAKDNGSIKILLDIDKVMEA